MILQHLYQPLMSNRRCWPWTLLWVPVNAVHVRSAVPLGVSVFLTSHPIDTYTLPLPANLPPTYKGRMLKFTYHLVVGVCRAAPTPSLGSGYAGHGLPGGGKGASTSRVMRVPIRIYNSVVGEFSILIYVSLYERPADIYSYRVRYAASIQSALASFAIKAEGTTSEGC